MTTLVNHDSYSDTPLRYQNAGYSLERAQYFGWASMSHALSGPRLELLRKHLVGPRVLDAGCGGGAYAEALFKMGYEVYAIDKTNEFLEYARRHHPGPQYHCADLNGTLPFPNRFFDSCFCFDVLEHVDDRVALKELLRVTRRKFLFTVPQLDAREKRWGITYSTYLDPTHLRYYRISDIVHIMRSFGTERIEVIPESRIPLELFVRNEFKAVSRYPWLTPIYNRLFRFIGARLKGPDWFHNWLAVCHLE